MFATGTLDISDMSFDILNQNSNFSLQAKGRKVGIMVEDCKDGSIPIVRTTTQYSDAPTLLTSAHYSIVDAIRKTMNMPLHFNNVMVEIYTNEYSTMGFHTDQAIDLENDSYICIFTCYQKPNAKNIRKLLIVNKQTEEKSEIKMQHNSFILFSTKTNMLHKHSIILDDESKKADDSEFMNITFRLSKTFIRFDENGAPHLPNGKVLRKATPDEQKQFYLIKGKENRKYDFKNPDIDFTISDSDMMSIKK